MTFKLHLIGTCHHSSCLYRQRLITLTGKVELQGTDISGPVSGSQTKYTKQNRKSKMILKCYYCSEIAEYTQLCLVVYILFYMICL